MALREMIRIDEAKCDGCGLCVSACAEGAIALINGKARLVSETYCDGLGACLGECPQGAITMEQVEAKPFDPEAVAVHLAKAKGAPALMAHPAAAHAHQPKTVSHGGGCPGSQAMSFAPRAQAATNSTEPSALAQWPVQLHLVNPGAPYFHDADVLLAADCVAFALGGFHQRFLAGRRLAIACPKLDSNQEVYADKLVALLDHALIRSLTVMIMEVPCCGGLARLAMTAAERAGRKIPVKAIIVGIDGEIRGEQMLANPAAA